MHQVLLLLLGKFFFYLAKLLHTYKEENSFHIGFFTKPFNKFCLQCPPSCLQIIFCLHRGKDSGLNFAKTDKMNFTKGRFYISTEKGKMDIDLIHSFLTKSYWAEGISKEIISRSIEGALCFGVFENDKQVGFARMITDRATFAYLADVFIIEEYRGLGLSKWLMEVIMSHPDLQGLRRMMLATRDAHELYKKFGFTSLNNVDRWMHIHYPDVYKAIK
jgi:GNAT superfamily N-acetyltransferase